MAQQLPGVFLDPRRRQREAAAGIWPDRILSDYFADHLAHQPDATAVIGLRCETANQRRLSYAELDEQARLIAYNLRRCGVQAGDIVSFQLPNWWQFVALHLACLRIGAISNPLMPIFRKRELRFMLGFAESKVLIVPQRFRGFDHATLARELMAELDSLRQVFIVGGDADDAFEAQLLSAGPDDATRAPAAVLQPDDVVQLLYTSGTTGEPKGVLHTSNTLLGILQKFCACLRLGNDDTIFMPSPLAHQTGFMYGMMNAIVLGAPLLLMDIWGPRQAAAFIADHQASFIFAATPFLTDLVYLPASERPPLPRLRYFVTAGAPIPPAVVTAAQNGLDATIICGWGMSECGLATMTTPEDTTRLLDSDGAAIPGIEVRVVDGQGDVLPPGTEGNLQFRGTSLFVGYLKRPQLYQVDADGWFDTGDLARLDQRGYLRIIGRSKDIIIRGGENIPVVEIENLIYSMPQVADVAIVAMPDPRLGEKACAFITTRSGRALSLADLTSFLAMHKLAKPYWPEHLEIVAEMPRTASGKIQKFLLRERARTLVQAG